MSYCQHEYDEAGCKFCHAPKPLQYTVKIDNDKIELASKFVFMASMLAVAGKMAEDMTPEEIAMAPYYVKHVLSKLASESKSWVEWCDNVKSDLIKEAIKK
jgi:hypothetical protein